MQSRGLQSVSSQASCSRTFVRGAAHNADARTVYKYVRKHQGTVKKGTEDSFPPPPKARSYVGSLGGDRRSTPRIAETAPEVVTHNRRVIKAYAQGQFASRVDDRKRYEQAVTSAVPTLEKRQFFSQPSPDEVEDTPEAGTSKVPSIPPGTFIEIRRNLVTTHGVVLSVTHHGVSRTITSLASNGEIWEHLQEDVMFALSRFIDPLTAGRCLSGHSPSEESSKSPDTWLSPHVLTARIKVLKELRTYEKQVEDAYHNVSMRIHDVLQRMPWANSEEWAEIATQDLARAVNASSALELFSVHKYLMAHHERFVAYPLDFLKFQRFRVRPWSQVQDLRDVSQMIGRNDPLLEAFYKKARRVVRARQTRPSGSDTISCEPDTTVSFTPEEQTIIRFLKAFVRSTRSTQKDPYVIPVATLMKRLAIYEDFFRTDQTLVHKFLVDLGVVTPWDDPIIGDRDLVLLPSSSNAPTPSTTLGPDEYYPLDIVEHRRHDFGNINAYVIDDVGAHELDDAISVEPVPSEPDSNWVHVHIADPTLKLHPGHTLSQQARKKFMTVYDVHQTVPMVPQSVMYDGLSLGKLSRQGLPETVLTFSFKVDGEGSITQYEVRPGLLRNVHVVRYDDVDLSLGRTRSNILSPFDPERFRMPSPAGVELSTSQVDELRALHGVMRRLVAKRVRNGMMYYSTYNSNVTMDANLPQTPTDLRHPYVFNGFPKLDYTVESQELEYFGARQIVAECMAGACRVASRFFRDRGIPAVRRAAEAPRPLSDVPFETILDARREDGMIPPVVAYKVGLDFPGAENTLLPKSHIATGTEDGEGYVRVTSPLRRYADMVHHWQIKHALAQPSSASKPLFSEEWLTAFAAEMTIKERGLRQIERRHNRFWSLKFMEQWLANPENKDKPNPLAEMNAILVKDIDFDIVNRRSRLTAFIPELGQWAAGEYLGEALTAPSRGDTIKVKFDSIKLGTAPELRVTAH